MLIIFIKKKLEIQSLCDSFNERKDKKKKKRKELKRGEKKKREGKKS